jgi:hypothetical protein
MTASHHAIVPLRRRRVSGMTMSSSEANRIRGESKCYISPMDALRKLLDEDRRIDYALLFGSSARGGASPIGP